MPIRFIALDTDEVRALQAGGTDANGQVPERRAAAGGEPCRHCLQPMAAGEEMLILAHRPFPAPQPYAEIGPIFMHARACTRGGGAGLPAFLRSPHYILRGYGADDRIVYGTGAVIPTPAIPGRAEDLLADPRVAYCHVRSATNNCFHCRIERA
ncbi:MAG: DUF1203 domain-containing protein [Hyphomicrobiaceae bacterium]|nr:DUF1203 domain-containing protein [Hyphomicrobiaceae bacterium]